MAGTAWEAMCQQHGPTVGHTMGLPLSSPWHRAGFFLRAPRRAELEVFPQSPPVSANTEHRCREGRERAVSPRLDLPHRLPLRARVILNESSSERKD